ncbi:MAG: lipid kinase [Gammaproteobacteria bacterium]|nr:lipid kinase [Gammaproteobacteria bacterium]
MPRALLVANPRARAGTRGVGSAVKRLLERGFAVDSMVTTKPDEVPKLIGAHCAPADVVIVGGGDGTLNVAATALIGCGRPVGILPLGTANDLARTLLIPFEPAAAMEVVAQGRTRCIDLGRVNGVYFFNVASVGLSVHVARRVTPELKQRFGALAYARAALTEITRLRPFRARIDSGNEHLEVEAVQIAVGNGRYHGGGTPVAAEAEVDDRQLFLYSIPPQRLLKLLRLVPVIRRGAHSETPHVLLLHGREFMLHTPRPMPVDTDGELTTHTPAHFEVLPAVLPVFVPEAYVIERERRAAQ